MNLTKSQELIVNTKNKTLLVSASAGSGKTFVVIERIIESIKKGQDVSRLLVLTFTNAAASELKERLINKLYELKDEYLRKGDKANSVRIAKQIAKVPMSDVSTIHSFCLNVIRNNFFNLGIDPSVSTLDATKATIMLNDAISEVIEEEFENSKEEFLDVLDIYGNEENLLNGIYMLYNAYKKAVPNTDWLKDTCDMYSMSNDKDLSETRFGNIILENIKDRLKLLKLELEQVIEKIYDDEFLTRKDMLKQILDKINTAILFETYDELYNYMDELCALPRLPSTKVSDEDLNNEIKSVKTKVSDELKDIKVIIYKDSKGIIQELNDSAKYIYWYKDIVERVDEKYTEAKAQKKSIDFTDYEHLALKALEFDDVVDKYKSKYDEIYIDEYQDTSNAQEAIIQKIGKINNVIMVGDVKQSIYGFRNAKPDLFSSKYSTLDEIIDDEYNEPQGKIILAQNFRSRKEVIDSTNDVFSMMMSDKFGGAKYGEKEALVYGEGYPEVQDDTYKTEINIIEKECEELEDNEDTELEDVQDIVIESTAVAKRINDMLTSNFKVYDLKKKEYRNCEYKDIVILLRTVEGKANIVSDVLKSHGIPSYADSKTGFYKSDEINLIVSFLKILDNTLDDIAMTSVMYSIIGKFTLDDLVVVRNINKQVSMYDVLLEANDKLEEGNLKNKVKTFLDIISRYREYLVTFNISEILLKLYNETGIYEAMRLEELGEMKCANLDAFVQIVSEFEKSENTSTLYSLLKYLKILKSKESSGDSPRLVGENDNVVRIMTIHKSKGLEFPVVILMNTAQKYNEQDTKDKLQFDDVLGIGIDVYNKELNLTYPTVIKQAIKANSKRQLRSEALRLLYVAFTRAKEKLIVYGTIPSLDKYTKGMLLENVNKISEVLAFSNNSHLKCILQAALVKTENFNLNLYNKADFILKDIDNKNVLNRNEDRFKVLIDNVKKYEIKGNKDEVDKLKEEITNVNLNVNDINKKYTVTELKMGNDESELLLNELKPNTLQEKVTGTSYGTFIHSIVEKIDFNNVTKENITKLIETQTKLFNIQINVTKVLSDILSMYESLKQYIADAKIIKRELEFVIKDKLEIIPELEFKDATLIQGVVDMYVETKEGKHIIIDFKTDRVESKQELIDRYSVQLKIYKRAIELSYGVEVSKTYIYSFALNELIEVE